MLKIARLALLAFTVVASGLLILAALMSDKLTNRQAAQRIMAADEPCRVAFESTLDLFEKNDGEEARKVSAEGEPVCREAFETLEKINIYVPADDTGGERRKRDAIKSCARLSRVRADLMGQFASQAPDEQRMRDLNEELGRADKACRAQFNRIAGS